MAIRLLSPEVSSRIAAGEVIERPASVVKELLENSLDAGATDISVEIGGGGAEYIRVADNGSGIPSDQVELAFQRFATSKLSALPDLEGVSTLGFRGEALPSIAAVSDVMMVTKSAGEEFGTRLQVVDGAVVRKEPHGAATGTSVEVRQLFKILPARRKFLRSPATEGARIHTLVTRNALAYPEVRFQMQGDRSVAFASGGSGDLREAVSSVYRLDVAQAMLEISTPDDTQNGLSPAIWGMVSPPSLDRANRSYISVFVNRRWVQNRMLSYAVEQAYHGFLKERRYPLAAVNIAIPQQEVDVNMHPAKAEVRFHRENQVFAALQQAVRQTLTSHSPVPDLRRAHARQAPASPPLRGPAFWPTEPFTSPNAPPTERALPADAPAISPSPDTVPSVPRRALPVLRVLGQVQSSYVAAEGPDGMYLIDQHAAHERVVFERVRAEVASRSAAVQSLLEPATVELTARQQELVESRHELLAGLGFAIEPFGGQTHLLRGVPSLLADRDPASAMMEVLDLMDEGGGFESWEERAAYSIACHGAIRAGKTMSQQEMSELARQLEECQQPHTCPHGRPTMIHLSSSHLEREFGRR